MSHEEKEDLKMLAFFAVIALILTALVLVGGQ